MKNPWPAAIIAFFVIFVASMVGFVIWTTHQREDLVSPDYYAQEIRYQQQIDATKRAQAEGVAPRISYDAAAKRIDVRFPAPAALAAATGTITLYCPSEAALDQKCKLQPDADGTQQIAAATLKPGKWRVKTEWTVGDKSYYAEEAVFVQ